MVYCAFAENAKSSLTDDEKDGIDHALKDDDTVDDYELFDSPICGVNESRLWLKKDPQLNQPLNPVDIASALTKVGFTCPCQLNRIEFLAMQQMCKPVIRTVFIPP